MSWLHRILGKDGSSQLGVDNTHFAARVSSRPMHLGANGGAYRLAVTSGTMAAGLAGNSEIFQARWTHATMKAILRSLHFCAYRHTTAFTAGVATFTATMARGWSADGGAGTPLVFSTSNTNKKRTDFSLSRFSDTGVRQSTTAALTAGTKTLDTNPFGSLGAFISSGATSVPDSWIIPPHSVLWQKDTSDEYPFLLEQNEGPVVRATVPATGTWVWSLMMEWAEVDASEVEGWA